jgi:21S rRNA (uridine2791-2'-O)-methyltransferase
VLDTNRGRTKSRLLSSSTSDEVGEIDKGYIDIERQAHLSTEESSKGEEDSEAEGESGGRGRGITAKKPKPSMKDRDEAQGRVVDVVLSDMSAPWDQTTGRWIKSVSNPYRRMMNTSGIGFKDHVGSMVSVSPYFSASSIG